MKFHITNLNEYIVPVGFVVSGIILGFIVEKILLFNVRRMAIKARWEGGRVIINSLRGITFLWFVIAGVYAAILDIETIGPKLFSYMKLGLAVVLILTVTVVLSKLSTGFVKLYTGKVLPTSIFVNVTKVFVFILGMLVLLQTIGISVAPIITALGVGGLAVALALQDTLSNLFAGLHIIASKKIKPGDYIKVDIGAEGFLEDITWRNTSIRTPQNNTVILPNNKMASAVITNYNIPSKELDVSLQVGVSYDSDLAKVERVTKEVAKEVLTQCCPGAPINEPALRFDSFAPSSINFTIIIRAREIADGGIIKHEFIKKLIVKYNQEGIKIPYPSTSVYFENSLKQ